MRLIIAVLSLAVASFAADCNVMSGVEIGTLQFPALDEASGLEASNSQAGVLYSHNDHGGDAKIYAFYDTGAQVGIITLDGQVAEDYEDITIGKIPGMAEDYIFVADVGNNDYDRTIIKVVAFKEPSVDDFVQGELTIDAADIITISMISPNAPSDDMETMMYDPVDGDIYLIEKDHDTTTTSVYKFTPLSETNETPIILQEMTTINHEKLVAGDIKGDGSRIALRQSHNDGAWIYERNAGQTVWEALRDNAPCDLSLELETQGEAIAWDRDDLGLYSTSEGASEPIYYYEEN